MVRLQSLGVNLHYHQTFVIRRLWVTAIDWRIIIAIVCVWWHFFHTCLFTRRVKRRYNSITPRPRHDRTHAPEEPHLPRPAPLCSHLSMYWWIAALPATSQLRLSPFPFVRPVVIFGRSPRHASSPLISHHYCQRPGSPQGRCSLL